MKLIIILLAIIEYIDEYFHPYRPDRDAPVWSERHEYD